MDISPSLRWRIGYKEGSITLPFSVQEPITKIINKYGLVSISDPNTIFYGTSKPLSEGILNITYPQRGNQIGRQFLSYR